MAQLPLQEQILQDIFNTPTDAQAGEGVPFDELMKGITQERSVDRDAEIERLDASPETAELSKKQRIGLAIADALQAFSATKSGKPLPPSMTAAAMKNKQAEAMRDYAIRQKKSRVLRDERDRDEERAYKETQRQQGIFEEAAHLQGLKDEERARAASYYGIDTTGMSAEDMDAAFLRAEREEGYADKTRAFILSSRGIVVPSGTSVPEMGRLVEEDNAKRALAEASEYDDKSRQKASSVISGINQLLTVGDPEKQVPSLLEDIVSGKKTPNQARADMLRLIKFERLNPATEADVKSVWLDEFEPMIRRVEEELARKKAEEQQKIQRQQQMQQQQQQMQSQLFNESGTSLEQLLRKTQTQGRSNPLAP